MHLPALCCNLAWFASQTGAYRRFAATLKHPAETQESVLFKILRSNAHSKFGRRYGFGGARSIREFRANVPLSHYDDYEPWIARIRAGTANVLTEEPVQRLAPTSGSSRSFKLLPYTAGLRRQFAAAIGPWIGDLFRSEPALMAGQAFWSATPNLPIPPIQSTVPIGFDEDTDYLGGLLKPLVKATLAVPESVSRIPETVEFRRSMLGHLLNAPELRLVSVWHPSFFMLLLDTLEREWESLLKQVREPRRREALRISGPRNLAALWPRLKLVSCWGDGPSQLAAAGLAKRMAHAKVQRKGLLATEAFVTIPFAGDYPVALRSHFFEFLDDTQRPHLLAELVPGSEYSVVVTTAGGLYRYQLGDRVRVTGWLERTPCLTFLGRDIGVADFFGEKLNERFVAAALDFAFAAQNVQPTFAMLVPELSGDTGRYTLFLECHRECPQQLAETLEQALKANPHYALCVSLGQLRPLRVECIGSGAFERYLQWCAGKGIRMGNVKPALLCADSDVTHALRAESFPARSITGPS